VTVLRARPAAGDRLAEAIASAELPNYVYSYPSKRAYRPVDPPITLEQAWASHRGALNLYLHIPFCGYRCSFCTLFLTTKHTEDLVDAYVASVGRQLRMYGSLLRDARIVSLYIGGGTPTTLTAGQFGAVFEALHDAFPQVAADAEIGVEGSPDTVRADLLAALRGYGVNRISMGVQSLVPEEAARAGRRYPIERVHEAAAIIAAAGFDNVNYDLIFGLEGQTRDSWMRSLEGTLALGPDTLTIYPIVFRPLTVIDRHRARSEDGFLSNEAKYGLYDETVDVLAALGYRQNTFVRFSKRPDDGLLQEVSDFGGVPLLGLGAGARSYSPLLHYSTDFAVRSTSTHRIIEGFVSHEHRPDEQPSIGFLVTEDEARRRYCILNLSLGRLDRLRYERSFGADLSEWQEELDALIAAECAVRELDGSIVLTRKGFKYSNVIATLFQSAEVSALEESYVPA
jgi:oxygen-independent coproporphyrinogen III oxidase